MVLCAQQFGCSGGGSSTLDDSGPGIDSNTQDSSTKNDAGTDGAPDGATDANDASMADDGDAGALAAIVFAHSPDTLYSFDVGTKVILTIGKFTTCSQNMNPTQVIDLAIDANGKAYVTTFDGLYSLDLKSASCTLIKAGNTYPNSLSFVPKGTIDPMNEVLVGYQGAIYVRIDTLTGAITNVGNPPNGYQSRGDIVSVQGGGTFLTVTGNGCGDCLLQVDPKTGGMIQNYGSVGHATVYGIAEWGGVVYGFDDPGHVFAVMGRNRDVRSRRRRRLQILGRRRNNARTSQNASKNS